MAKKYFQKVPRVIARKVESFASRPFVIAAVVEIPIGDEFPNLPGVDTSCELAVSTAVLPDPRKGTWARRNTTGWEIKRNDLPKETKTYSHESPNFGDWSRGSHEVSWDREVYQREYFAGYGTPINVTELRRSSSTATYTLELDRVFDRMPKDEREFLFALNIFQEAVGTTDVRPTDEDPESFIRSLRVEWELLPPGERDETLKLVRQRLKPTAEEEPVLLDRMDFALSLRPEAIVTGTSHFARYFGAKVSDGCVVFENLRYGNAVYVMFENWEELSQLSRTELIRTRDDFERVTHKGGWKNRVRVIVRRHR